jgi:AAA family ATP:ADP antiporter
LLFVGVVWVEVEWTLLSLLFWSFAQRSFDLREAKREFAQLAAGEPAGLAVGGAATLLLTQVLPPIDLLLCSAVALLAAIGWAAALAAHERLRFERATSARGRDEPAPVGALFRGSAATYVLAFFGTVFVAKVTHLVVDNAFHAAAATYFTSEAELARFLGLFIGLCGALTVVGNLTAAGPLIRRFGVFSALLFPPAPLLAASAALAVAYALPLTAALLFTLAVGAKLIDESIKGAFYGPAEKALYQPLPPRLRPWRRPRA